MQLYFNENSEEKTNWQKVAAVAALLKNFLVISGSPGTGKTTAITKIMALVLDVSGRPLLIALAAPTGKAAARLQESVNKMKEKLNCQASIKEMMPGGAQTIHRLLGPISNSPYFRFNRKNHLPYDLIVIDEASMVDLPLLAKLIAALPPDACLILLGDKDQLASVEVGVVLGDICSHGSPGFFLPDLPGRLIFYPVKKLSPINYPPALRIILFICKKITVFPEKAALAF